MVLCLTCVNAIKNHGHVVKMIPLHICENNSKCFTHARPEVGDITS